MKELIGITLVALAITGCKSEIDNAETVIRNGLIYKYGETDPFTGLVLNTPAGIPGISALCNSQVEKGRYSGKSECFYNSQKVYEVEFSAGSKDGTETVFDAETGETKSVKNWKSNRLHGTAEEYLNGTLVSRKEYKNGLQDGDEAGWSEDGQTKLTEITWSNGKELNGFKTYFDTSSNTGLNNPSGTYNYLNGKLHGQQITYSRTDSGKQYTHIEKYFQNGKQDGIFKRYISIPNTDVIQQDLEILYKNDDTVSGWFRQYSRVDGRLIQEIKLIRAPNDEGKGFYDDYPGTLVPDGLIKKYNALLDTTTGEELWVHGVKVDHPPQPQESQESSTHIREEETPREEYLADSTQAFSSEACLDAWITAYRKEIGDAAMIVSEQIDEWKDWCGEGKLP
ncbi:toxin-antitoxin system YwqK family antitoxin [Pseudomonas aeruginosa]|jgi:antitoxin component YwqK of YwqJK toxin-antitoxin module|uniref:toxin-antitoxin system YwqK family antitoxin n=1 Tax=Pseudomonadaceae TaxID=135621 RepID=UPI0022329D28|nr:MULTISPECIES: hypothetical protein [Pseudomonadaceae]MDV5862516.1 hypothetical protein [Pseudomonas mendocina]